MHVVNKVVVWAPYIAQYDVDSMAIQDSYLCDPLRFVPSLGVNYVNLLVVYF